MSLYKCSKCDYKSYFKTNVEKHINKKNKCSKDNLEIIVYTISINCEYCNKNFSSMANRTRHLKICKNKIKTEGIRIRELEEENRELEEKNKELKKTLLNQAINITNNTANTVNNNINVNNNYITISLTPYNDPNMEGMQHYLEAALRKTFLSVPNLIESVHFNDKFPENQNICITNRRTKDARVFDGKKWKTINKDILISEIVDTYERELTNYAEEKGRTKYLKEYDKAKQRGKNAEKDLKEEVHNVIYDNSDKVNTKIKEVTKQVEEQLSKQLSKQDQDQDQEQEQEFVPDNDNETDSDF